MRFDKDGAAALQLGYKGSQGYLTSEQRQHSLAHIQSHQVFGPKELRAYLQTNFGVVFKSMQSYYELLHEAGMSWHKSQKTNPKKDEKQVKQRRKAIKKS